MTSPAWNEWAFWLKDPESVRNLAFTVGSIAAILGGAIGIFLASMRSVAAVRQARAAADTQITKLLTDAIGFLADKDKVELRLGAIYSLERIAQKSRADRLRVLEILYAFLRGHTAERIIKQGDAARIPPDIQACLDVIARNPPPRVFLRKHSGRLTLANVDLRNADLQGAHLRNAYLHAADLRGANLSDSDLRGSNLAAAKLQGASMRRCRLSSVDLTGADLTEGDFEGANFDRAKLGGAIFDKSKLQKATFEQATLIDATFIEANLFKANFRGSNLSRANFTRAKIAGADFRFKRVTTGGSPPTGGGRTIIYPTILAGANFSATERSDAKFEEVSQSASSLHAIVGAASLTLKRLRSRMRKH